MALPEGVRSQAKSPQFLGAQDSWDGIWWLNLVRNTVSGRPVFFLDCMLICLLALSPVFSIFLAKAGTQVIVPFRDEDEKRHLKVMGDLGQIVPLVCCISRRVRSGILTRLDLVGMEHEERTTNRGMPETLECRL